jgi:hypothetical protein
VQSLGCLKLGQQAPGFRRVLFGLIEVPDYPVLAADLTLDVRKLLVHLLQVMLQPNSVHWSAYHPTSTPGPVFFL